MAEHELDTLTETLKTWAATRPDEIVFVPSAGYYSYDIVVDAYIKGKGDGQEIGKEVAQNLIKEQVRKIYYNNALLTTQALSLMIKKLSDNKFNPTKLFVNNSIEGTSVLFAVSKDTHINESFIDLAYSESSKLKLEYFDKGLNLKIGFISDTSELNIPLLKSDGFGFALDLTSNKEI